MRKNDLVNEKDSERERKIVKNKQKGNSSNIFSLLIL